MNHPSPGLTGAVCVSLSIFYSCEQTLSLVQVVAVYIAGEAAGALTQTFIGDKLRHIRFMQLMCVAATIGTSIQTAAVNIAMFLAGRVLAGFAVG
jgi:predicted MFS family arabinose efflux permease